MNGECHGEFSVTVNDVMGGKTMYHQGKVIAESLMK